MAVKYTKTTSAGNKYRSDNSSTKKKSSSSSSSKKSSSSSSSKKSSSSSSSSSLQKAESRLAVLKPDTISYETQLNEINVLKGGESNIKVTSVKQGSSSSIKTAIAESKEQSKQAIVKQTIDTQKNTLIQKQAEASYLKAIAEQKQPEGTLKNVADVNIITRSIKPEYNAPIKEQYLATYTGQKEAEIKGISQLDTFKQEAIKRIQSGESTPQKEQSLLESKQKEINQDIKQEGLLKGNIAFQLATQEQTKKKLEVNAFNKNLALNKESDAIKQTSTVKGILTATPEQLFIKARTIDTNKVNEIEQNRASLIKTSYNALATTKGVASGIAQNPLKVGVGLAVGVGLSLIPEPVTTAGGLSLIGTSATLIGAGVTGAYAGSVGASVYNAPSGYKAETFGNILERDAPVLVGIGLGLKAGQIAVPKTKAFIKGFKQAPVKSTFVKSQLKDTFPSLDPLKLKTEKGYVFDAQTKETFIPTTKTQTVTLRTTQTEFNTIKVSQKAPGFDLPITKQYSSKVPGQAPKEIQSDLFAVSGKGGRQLQLKAKPYEPIKIESQAPNELTFYEKAQAKVKSGEQYVLKVDNPVPEITRGLLKREQIAPSKDIINFGRVKQDVLEGKQYKLTFKQQPRTSSLGKKAQASLSTDYKSSFYGEGTQFRSTKFVRDLIGKENIGFSKPKIDLKDITKTQVKPFAFPSSNIKSNVSLKIGNEINIKTNQFQGIKYDSKLDVTPIQDLSIKSVVDIVQVQDLNIKGRQISRSTQQTGQFQIAEQIISPVQKIQPIQITSPVLDIITPIKPIQTPIRINDKYKPQVRTRFGYIPRLKSSKSEQGYNVLVRSRGKFSKVSNSPLSKSEALSYGRYRVGKSASATFKIEKASSGKLGSFKGEGYKSDFYSNKKGEYIEKRERRIKSGGELQQITYKGIQANRNKGFRRLLK